MAVMKQMATVAGRDTLRPSNTNSMTGASSHTGEAWHDIEWRQVHREVRRLQARIVSDGSHRRQLRPVDGAR